MSLFSYLWGYFETNHFTLALLVVILFLSLLKYVVSLHFLDSKFTIFFILFLGIALRIGWIFYSSHTPQTEWGRNVHLESDITNIHAIELAERGVWFHDSQGNPSGRRPIGYPIFLAILYRIFGVHPLVASMANLFLYVVSAVVLYFMTRALFFNRTALLAVFVFSLFSVSVFSVKLLTDEHLFLPFWYGGLLLLMKGVRSQFSRWTILWLGLIFGYATMIRTHSIFMPFIVALAYLLTKHSWKKTFLSFFAVLFVMQLLNLPWIIRNYKVWGVPVL